MMTKPVEVDDGGPAFPWGEHGTHLGGMTLRDYFAAKAMAAIISDPQWMGGPKNCSEWAYKYADAMIEARSQVSAP